jgi:MFS family permease
LPALDLASLRVAPLWSSCLAMLLFTAAFGGMLFGNVLFLTTIWHAPAAVVGLWLSPGPVVVVLVSLTIAHRLVGRFGSGPVAALGATLYGVGAAIWLWRIGPHPNYLGPYLVGQLLTGTGVGLVMPSLSAVVGAVLPSVRWGTGSTMVKTARQIGTVLGTAVMILLYQPVFDLNAFRRGWVFLVCAALAAATIAGATAIWLTSDDSGQLPEQGRLRAAEP